MTEHIFPDAAHHREGSKDKNCGGCVYFSDGRCDVYDTPTDAADFCDSYESEITEESDMGNGIDMSELFCSDSNVVEADGLIWKTVLRTGTWKYRPGPGQKPIPIPLSVVAGNSPDPKKVIGLADLVNNFNNKAVEHVTIPKSHQDKVDENTGYTRQLRIENDPDRQGHYILRAGMEFTEPDIKQKVLNKSIANTSCGLYYDYIRKDDGKKFPVALAHVALTNSPWINGMRPFGMSENETLEIKSFEFSEDMSKPEIKIENGTLPVNLDGKTFLAPFTYTVDEDGAPKLSFSAQAEWKEKPEGSTPPTKPNEKETVMTVIPGLEGVELAEDVATKVAEFLAAKQAEVTAATADAEALRASNDELALSQRKAEVEAKVTKLKDELGLSEQPGFLKVVRQVLLADDGSNKLTLSEDGKSDEEVSFADVVNRLIDALPKKDGKVNFGEQAESLGTEGKPPVNAADENKTADERYEDAFEALYGHKPKTKK